MCATLTCAELEQRLQAGALAVDVMTPEDYAACHLRGAVNACVYEMVFLDRMRALVPDRGREIVVVDATGQTWTGEYACERLELAGYTRVAALEGGLAAWRAAGLPVASVVAGGQDLGCGPDPFPPLPVPEGDYLADTELSALEWTGRNPAKRHSGRIRLKSGTLALAAGQPTAATLILDMASIEDQDLEDPYWRDLLVKHLKSEDFFAVERFPAAAFALTGWTAMDVVTPEAQGGMAQGSLTIRDVTRPVEFPAVLAPQPDGSLRFSASLDLDRTLWDVCYGSGRLFERLGMHLVSDVVSLELFVLARPAPAPGKPQADEEEALAHAGSGPRGDAGQGAGD